MLLGELDLRTILIGVGVLFLIIVFFTIISFLSVWLKALSSGAPVSLLNLVVMRWLRKLPHSLIVDARIMAVKAVPARPGSSSIGTAHARSTSPPKVPKNR